jgi:CTP:phosphocholine cytidylyltransferase-like protein
VWCEGQTSEWLMDVEDGIVNGCSATGGAHGWQLISVSRWTEEDGERLKRHLEMECESGNRQIYWDDVAMFCHFPEYTLGIFEMQPGDVEEIDSLEELVRLDPGYSAYLKEKNHKGGAQA